jgi:hypothetical protein
MTLIEAKLSYISNFKKVIIKIKYGIKLFTYNIFIINKNEIYKIFSKKSVLIS